jgi:hypothetical protein
VQTVSRTPTASQLTGGPGQDWFWFAVGTKSSDSLKNPASGEAGTFEKR